MNGPLQWKFVPIIAGIVPMFGLAITLVQFINKFNLFTLLLFFLAA